MLINLIWKIQTQKEKKTKKKNDYLYNKFIEMSQKENLITLNEINATLVLNENNRQT